MDPSKIEINSISKLFEYEKISREIENCEDIQLLKNISKSYVKLYFAQQECLTELNNIT
jgi:hypothetical protein